MDDYPHLLHAGVVPTAQEHVTILAAKHSSEEQRRKHIKLLKAQLEEAQDYLERLEQQIDAHARLLFPLRRIPSEILRDIFAYASPPTPPQPFADRVLHAPWTTMEVCKHWHDVCLEYGSLWSNIIIDIAWHNGSYILGRPLLDGQRQLMPYGPHPRIDEQLAASLAARNAQLVQTQLRRSRTVDLSVTFKIDSQHGYGQPYLRILLPHLHRIVAPRHVLAELTVMHRIEGLKHLELSSLTTEDSLSSEEVSRMERLLKQPNLRFFQTTIRIPQIGLISDTARPLDLSLFQSVPLTSLRMVKVPDGWESLRPVLPQLRILVRLHLTDGFEGQAAVLEETSQLDRVSFSELQDLSVSHLNVPQSGYKIYQLFSHILAPALRRLSCSNVNSTALSLVEGFIVESRCRLESLEMQSGCNKQSLVCFLRSDSDSMNFLKRSDWV